MSNLPGPGRLLGNLFSKAGSSLERHLGKLAHRAGLGSYAQAETDLLTFRLSDMLESKIQDTGGEGLQSPLGICEVRDFIPFIFFVRLANNISRSGKLNRHPDHGFRIYHTTYLPECFASVHRQEALSETQRSCRGPDVLVEATRGSITAPSGCIITTSLCAACRRTPHLPWMQYQHSIAIGRCPPTYLSGISIQFCHAAGPLFISLNPILTQISKRDVIDTTLAIETTGRHWDAEGDRHVFYIPRTRGASKSNSQKLLHSARKEAGSNTPRSTKITTAFLAQFEVLYSSDLLQPWPQTKTQDFLIASSGGYGRPHAHSSQINRGGRLRNSPYGAKAFHFAFASHVCE